MEEREKNGMQPEEKRGMLERLGYDKAAHDSQFQKDSNYVMRRVAKNYKVNMAVHIAVIVAALALIAVKLLFFN